MGADVEQGDVVRERAAVERGAVAVYRHVRRREVGQRTRDHDRCRDVEAQHGVAGLVDVVDRVAQALDARLCHPDLAAAGASLGRAAEAFERLLGAWCGRPWRVTDGGG